MTILQAADGVTLVDDKVLRECLTHAVGYGGARYVEFASTFYKPQGWYFLAVRQSAWLQVLHERLFSTFKDRLARGRIDRAKVLNGYTAAERSATCCMDIVISERLGVPRRDDRPDQREGSIGPGESELVTSYQDAFRGVVARCRWSECI